MSDASPEVATRTSLPPMSARWWLFLIFLWTVVLVGAAPLLLLPAVEHRSSVVTLPIPDVTSVSFIQKKPILDWLDRHTRYSLEVVRQDKVTRYGSPSSPWQMAVTQSGIELKSSEGTIYVPLAPSAK